MIFDIAGNLKTKCGNLDLLFRGIAKYNVYLYYAFYPAF